MGIEWIILLLLFVEYSIFLPKIFAKAGIAEAWKGYIPVYNLLVMIKIMKKPWWWILFMLCPGVNLLMLMAMNLELARVFNRFGAGDTLLAIFLPHVMLPKLALKPEIQYVGATDWTNTQHREIRKVSDMIVLALVSVGIFNVLIALYRLVGAKDKPGHKTLVKEWGDALLFAIVAASIIRTFFLEAFKIPTPSMEKNLLVGDFLFVSKISYGPKIPQTPVAFPFVHHTLPLVETKSYLNIFELPYYRLPGLGNVQRNDVVVFNFPCGDTVKVDEQDKTYYQLLVDNAFANFDASEGRKYNSYEEKLAGFEKSKSYYLSLQRKTWLENGMLTVRPVDKEDHYIKRCVAVAGDSIKIVSGDLYVNGKRSGDTEKMEFFYEIRPSKMPNLSMEDLMKDLKDNFDVNKTEFGQRLDGVLIMNISNENVQSIAGYFGGIKALEKTNDKPGYYHKGGSHGYFEVFPNNSQYNWTKDNFGTLWIPKEGATVQLDLQNLPLYKRIIEAYEHNRLEVKGSDIFINGSKATSYTFKQNYYWLMGDNRQNSLDSRFWGFVPEDHVVGKGVLVWFSSDPEGGVRWNRIFKLIR